MTQGPMTLTEVTGQGQMSKIGQKSKKWSISRKLFHLQTSYLVPLYNPLRHIKWSMCPWPWPYVKVTGQGQISHKCVEKKRKVNLVKVIGQGQMSNHWTKYTKWAICRMLFHLQTSYLVPRYNPLGHTIWPKCRWFWP